MSFLTRAVLDEILPENLRLEQKARKIARISNQDVRPLEACLLWLTDTVEHDRFSGFAKDAPEWRRKAGSRVEDWWDMSMDGLEYKPSHKYLTTYGWPLGSTCWFVRIECGHRELVAAESPTFAVMRAVVVMHCWLEWRKLPPDERPDLIKKIEEFMNS